MGLAIIKSAMTLIRGMPVETTPTTWKHLWRTQIPQRIKFFLWLVTHDRLMTNTNRYIRGLTNDPRCGLCGDTEEDSDHILRKCPNAVRVWKKFPWINEQELPTKPFREWIYWNLTDKNQSWMV